MGFDQTIKIKSIVSIQNAFYFEGLKTLYSECIFIRGIEDVVFRMYFYLKV